MKHLIRIAIFLTVLGVKAQEIPNSNFEQWCYVGFSGAWSDSIYTPKGWTTNAQCGCNCGYLTTRSYTFLSDGSTRNYDLYMHFNVFTLEPAFAYTKVKLDSLNLPTIFRGKQTSEFGAPPKNKIGNSIILKNEYYIKNSKNQDSLVSKTVGRLNFTANSNENFEVPLDFSGSEKLGELLIYFEAYVADIYGGGSWEIDDIYLTKTPLSVNPSDELENVFLIKSNPVINGLLEIDFNLEDVRSLSVFDISGNRLISNEGPFTNDGVTFNIQNFAKGIYQVYIERSQGVLTKKLIVE